MKIAPLRTDRSLSHGPTLDLEITHCVLCSKTEGTSIFDGNDREFETCSNHFHFIRCTGCSHVYLQPRPRMADFPVIYRNYLTSNTDSAYYPSPLVAAIKNNLFDRLRMRRITNHLKPGAKVLDIGAGAGRLLQTIQSISKHPIQLYANEIEFSKETLTSLNESEIKTIEGPIEEWDTDLRFDVITGIHVIEHVMDPGQVLRWISKHLTSQGVLYLETPDLDSVCAKIFKSHWGMTHFPRHLNLFSKIALAKLAEQSDLQVIHHGGTTSAPAWNMSIRNMLGMNALTKKKSALEIFNYTNPFTLGFFTLVDILILTLKLSSSTQQLVAVKQLNGSRPRQ